MIGTIDVCPQTYSPDFPLDTLKSFVNSPSSIRIRNVPKKVGKWRITNVFVTVAYPDNTTHTIECVLTGGVYVATFEGCSSTGKVEKGLTISANGKDENDNDVTGYVLGKGDVEILEARENTSPGETVYYIHLLEDEPDVPTDGDMYKKDGNYVVYQNGVETQLGVSQENMESYVDQKVEEVEEAIPTKTSDLQNDSGFTTQTYVDEKVGEVEGEIPTKTSDLTNDSNFITSAQVTPATSPVGYAKNAFFSGYLMISASSTAFDGNSHVSLLPTENGKGASVKVTLPTSASWFLSEYNGNTYDPPIELIFGYCNTVYTIITVGGSDRKTITNVKSFAWFAQGEREGYVIKAVANGSSFVPDDKMRIGRTEHPVTYNTAKTSIETIDGQSGMIACTRANTITTYTDYELAYKDELPTKVSDLTNDSQYVTTTEVNTALALKQDKLSNTQVSAIDSVVDEKQTFVKFTDNTTATYDIYGSFNGGDWVQNVSEIKFGTGVKAIGLNVFSGCTNLTKVKFPDTLDEIVWGAFDGCTGLTNIVIPDNVTLIMANVFTGCTGLTSVVFEGKSKSQIQSMADYPWGITDTSIIYGTVNDLSQPQLDALNLTMDKYKTVIEFINPVETVKYIWNGAITQQTMVDEGLYDEGLWYWKKNINTVNISETVTSIGANTFYVCGFTKMVIPRSVETIGANAFAGGTQGDIVFKDRTLSEVQAMANYPWGITDTSKIKTFNVASKEWVEERLAQLLAQLQS